jgi:hypothetical protein
MNYFRKISAIACVLLASAVSAPAPIREEATPTQTPIAKPKTVPERARSKTTGDQSHQFDGTWKGTRSESDSGGTRTTKYVLVIRNSARSASVEQMVTGTPTTSWNDMPTEYSKSPLIFKWRSVSTDLKLDGSNLRVRWEPIQLVEWSPKGLPLATIEAAKKQSAGAQGARISVYTLRGDQLTREFDSDGRTTYTRVKQ